MSCWFVICLFNASLLICMHCGLKQQVSFVNFPHLQTHLHGLLIFCFLCHALLLIPNPVWLLGGEFSEFSCFKSHLHVQLICALSFPHFSAFCMHCGLKQKVSFVNFPHFKTLLNGLLICGLSWPFFIAYFKSYLIIRRWVQWNFMHLVKPACFFFLWLVLDMFFTCSYFNAMWITSRWVQWIFMLLIKPACMSCCFVICLSHASLLICMHCVLK